MTKGKNTKKVLEDKIDTEFEALKKQILYFHDKDFDYAENMVNWLFEIGIKNKKIHQYRGTKNDKEKVQRRRARVYWMDFGVNIGSEFNYDHFCVVIKEFDYHALVVPITSVKEDKEQEWKSEEKLFVEIGEIEDLPGEKLDAYACIGQMRSVSKQRLSSFKYKGKFVNMKLNNDQMDAIDKGIVSLCTNK